MKKVLKYMLAILMPLVILLQTIPAFAIGSDYYVVNSAGSESEMFYDNSMSYFNLNHRYVMDWVKEQNFYIENYLSPETVLKLKKEKNNYSSIVYDDFAGYSNFTDSLFSYYCKKLRLDDNSTLIQKLYNSFIFDFYSSQYSLYKDCTGDMQLYYHSGVCQDFSSTFKRFCETLGIKCDLVSSEKLNHAWNELYIDGQLYLCDCTFGVDSFLITPDEFNKLWERNVYLFSDGKYKIDDPKSSNWKIYAAKRYQVNLGKSPKHNYVKSLSVNPVCNGYLLRWNNDNSDYYLIKRMVYKSGKCVSDDYLKYVFPSDDGKCEFVDESATKFSDCDFKYIVIKQKFSNNIDSDSYASYDYTSPTSKYVAGEHLWANYKKLSEPQNGNLGCCIYKCSICHTQMVAYTSNQCCTNHDFISFTENGSKYNKCSKCGILEFLGSYSLKKVKIKKKKCQYTGKSIYNDIEAFNSSGQPLKLGKDYLLSFKNNVKVGKAVAIVDFVGLYSGRKQIKFNIDLNNVSLKIKPNKNFVSLSWKKAKGINGYQIQLATDKKFKKNKKTVTLQKRKYTNVNIKKLKSDKKYYARVRTYKFVNNKKVYSTCSKVKTFKTK